ncbi:MAG TPA: DoxX family protein [Candidatus Acidoferrales bacterium]|jgi:hypothetical protein
MQPATQPDSISGTALWSGRIISGLVTAFMIFDGTIHIMKPPPVVQAFAQLGFPIRLAIPLGIVSLTCALLYAIPQTSILGAILLTGYLGGAVAVQVPTQNPFFGEVIFPVYIGIFVWGGIFLREERLRKLIPFRS